jgi:cyclopropane fatty-acyl-phospholipid synthase-like methyltransferase
VIILEDVKRVIDGIRVRDGKPVPDLGCGRGEV